MTGIVRWWDRRQVLLYLAAILAGGVAGSVAPGIAPTLAVSINPVLALLLFATFLGVPLIEVGRSFRDLRFLGTVVVVNFVVVPVVVFGLSRFVADDQGLLIGVLLVLLTPCVDYVIVFTGLAGGAKARLLAATPLLMLLQLVLLPAYLALFAGGASVGLIEIGPFVEAFLKLIVAPLVAAAIVQALAVRHRAGRVVEAVMAGAMVPLMMLTLAVVIGSQIAAVGGQAIALLRVVPLYAVFLVVMLVVGVAAGRVARLDVASTRAVVFSGSTRNSLVVLPLALALPASLSIAPLAVVTQTLVELIGMVAFIRLVPRLTGSTGRPRPSASSRAPRRPDVTTVELVGGVEALELELHEHDSRWAVAYLEHRRRIRQALGAGDIEIEHIGSTSVPGLAAKPIIDIAVTVPDITAEEDYLDALLDAGYLLRVREPGHRLVRTPARDAHVHVYERGDPAVENYLILRDHLRSDAADRTLYEDTKRSLLRVRWDDMNAYSDAKTDVILAIMSRARGL